MAPGFGQNLVVESSSLRANGATLRARCRTLLNSSERPTISTVFQGDEAPQWPFLRPNRRPSRVSVPGRRNQGILALSCIWLYGVRTYRPQLHAEPCNIR